MSNTDVTYLVGGCCAALGLIFFTMLVIVPTITAYKRIWERVAVLVLSAYVLAALIGIGVVLGALVILEWPRLF